LYADPHGQQHMDAFEERLRDNTVTPAPEAAAFRIDFPAWLVQLGPRNREIAQDMALDLGTHELAARHKVSAGRISQMRREFCMDWRRFHGQGAQVPGGLWLRHRLLLAVPVREGIPAEGGRQ
jgi:hypothetical protein